MTGLALDTSGGSSDTRTCLQCHEELGLEFFPRVGRHCLLICEDCNDNQRQTNHYLTEEHRRKARLASHRKYNQARRAAGVTW